MKVSFFILILLGMMSCSSDETDTPMDTILEDKSIYFPPINSNTWETVSISELNWNENQLQPLLDYLEEKTPKALSFFIMVKSLQALKTT